MSPPGSCPVLLLSAPFPWDLGRLGPSHPGLAEMSAGVEGDRESQGTSDCSRISESGRGHLLGPLLQVMPPPPLASLKLGAASWQCRHRFALNPATPCDRPRSEFRTPQIHQTYSPPAPTPNPRSRSSCFLVSSPWTPPNPTAPGYHPHNPQCRSPGPGPTWQTVCAAPLGTLRGGAVHCPEGSGAEGRSCLVGERWPLCVNPGLPGGLGRVLRAGVF